MAFAVSDDRVSICSSGAPPDESHSPLELLRNRGLIDIALLHGFGASTFTWRYLIGPLRRAGHRVEALDRPWGDVREQTEATRNALDVLGFSSVLLIGHSAGAEVAVSLAAHQPDRVGGLVLLAPVIGRGPPAPVRWLARMPGTSFVAPRLLRAATRWIRPALALAWYDKNQVTEGVASGYRRPLLEAGVAEALWRMTAVRKDRAALTNAAASVQQPALVLVGDHDRWTTWRSVPNAVTVVIPNCGHVPQEEQPARTLDEVLTHISRLSE